MIRFYISLIVESIKKKDVPGILTEPATSLPTPKIEPAAEIKQPSPLKKK